MDINSQKRLRKTLYLILTDLAPDAADEYCKHNDLADAALSAVEVITNKYNRSGVCIKLVNALLILDRSIEELEEIFYAESLARTR